MQLPLLKLPAVIPVLRTVPSQQLKLTFPLLMALFRAVLLLFKLPAAAQMHNLQLAHTLLNKFLLALHYDILLEQPELYRTH